LNNDKPRSQGARIYDDRGVAVTLNASGVNSWYKINKIGNVRNGHQNGGVYSPDRLSPCQTAGQYKDPIKIVQPVLTPDRENKRQNGRRMKEDGEPMFTLTAQDKHGVYDGMTVRKLTPVECERLQGFPDDWTKIGKDDEQISDTQRYKCCGNAVTTNVITAIVNEMFEGVKE
jgi:DNA (cytosine-5)-methyltransferase 1